MKILVAAILLLSGCAHRDPFRENIQELIDCQYKWTRKDGISIAEIHELQAGCYTLYQMRADRIWPQRTGAKK